MRGSLSQDFFGCCDNALDFEAEFFEQIFQRAGRSERTHADYFSFGANIAVPTEDGFHFDGNARGYVGRQNAFFVGGVLLFKQLPARHADDAAFDAVGGQLFISRSAEADFSSASEQDDVWFSDLSVR